MSQVRMMLAVLTLMLLFARASFAEGSGVLLLAHGGSAGWNAHVAQLVSQVDRVRPTEVAFGMATRATIQAAVDRLAARGVTQIVAVPLFVSSSSSVIAATEYLLGARSEAPPELAVFARMSHGSGGHGSHAAANDNGNGYADATRPVTSPVPLRMTRALDDHPVVAEILTTRARAISQRPAAESLVVVAHGPNGDDENRKWLEDMATIARRIAEVEPFASVDYLTVRDDAPKTIRDQATAELRALVTRRTEEGRRVLVVPLLVSFGGIERGLRQRLEGLTYTISDAGLLPDERLVAWVLAMAGAK